MPISVAVTEDLTLDEVRALLAPEIPQHAAFDGWSELAVERAGDALGVDPAVARLAFAGGAVDMIDAWFAHIDRAMLADLPPERLSAMKIRARIAALVEARLALVAPDIEALRRALAILALPTNLPRSAKLGWRAADAMWRAAGDRATDYNYYTKRALLSALYGSTLLAMLSDDSEDFADTRGFLSRRIDNVMQFEKVKGRMSHSAPERLSLARFLGRLRYPSA